MRKLISVIIFLVLAFSINIPVFAAFSFKIDQISPTTVSLKDQEVTINLSINDLPSESYFRVAWQKTEGGSYFGYIKNNNGEWIKIKSLSDDCSFYYKVTDTGISAITLFTKIGEDTAISPGTYKLKAHRFTTGGCSNTAAANEVEIIVNIPDPTPTSTLIPTSTNTPTPTKTSTPTSVPSATKTPTPKPTIKLVNTPTSIPILPSKKLETTGQILGQTNNINISSSPSENTNEPARLNLISGAKISLVLGLLFCGIAIMIFTQRFQGMKKSDEKT